VDFLETLDVPCYKIASFELVDLALIRRVAQTRKPLIMSTGMATLAEIDEAVRTALDAGARQIALLKCTSAYPASPVEMNLRTIPHMAAAFGLPVGLSDHTLGSRYRWRPLPWGPASLRSILLYPGALQARTAPFLWSPESSRKCRSYPDSGTGFGYRSLRNHGTRKGQPHFPAVPFYREGYSGRRNLYRRERAINPPRPWVAAALPAGDFGKTCQP